MEDYLVEQARDTTEWDQVYEGEISEDLFEYFRWENSNIASSIAIAIGSDASHSLRCSARGMKRADSGFNAT